MKVLHQQTHHQHVLLGGAERLLKKSQSQSAQTLNSQSACSSSEPSARMLPIGHKQLEGGAELMEHRGLASTCQVQPDFRKSLSGGRKWTRPLDFVRGCVSAADWLVSPEGGHTPPPREDTSVLHQRASSAPEPTPAVNTCWQTTTPSSNQHNVHASFQGFQSVKGTSQVKGQLQPDWRPPIHLTPRMLCTNSRPNVWCPPHRLLRTRSAGRSTENWTLCG